MRKPLFMFAGAWSAQRRPRPENASRPARVLTVPFRQRHRHVHSTMAGNGGEVGGTVAVGVDSLICIDNRETGFESEKAT
ncbi:hypothetical protein JW905_07875 [bacterium]|nr:hypothetical protein [candidate division CSSED10-310 bacterium]